ncbi:preprotein translocase subunit SecA [Parafrankia sp. FMc6]|uniref:preprotein translocase subunit SecA n=1 Tax=Parafrankia soli TaxID=2599596 RepID=UPI0034D416F2
MASNAPVFDVHARFLIDSLSQMQDLVVSLARVDDPLAEIDAAFEETLSRFVARLKAFNPFRLMEVARLAFLPWAAAGQIQVDPASSAARVELLTALALAARNDDSFEPREIPPVQTLSHFVSEASDELDRLFRLAHIRAIAGADPTDKMTMIAILVRGYEVWVRNGTYPDMAKTTIVQLFNDNDEVRNELLSRLGFDVNDALAVLTAVHRLQVTALNERFQAMAESIHSAMGSDPDVEPDPEIRDAARAVVDAAWEPDEDDVSVGVDELVAATGVPQNRVHAIADRFRLDLSATTPAAVMEAFTAGDNPWRPRPLVVTDSGRFMLPHDALLADAIRHNFEAELKDSAIWETYAKHRGGLLETRVSGVLARVLPGANLRDGYEYYIPATQEELNGGDPNKYTKRVEGDHLVLVDDVALVVEDKAVAFSAQSRGGKVNRMRTDLTGIITKAANQSGRMHDAILRDGGVRIEGEGWVDLGHIREVHTIAVSLDDLSSVTTATAELVRAGILEPSNIPWTVSLHDLELIAELVDRPAEFLLYLRRRRNPDVTQIFKASDELDLFLYFFEAGLWVEPDPDQVRTAFPFMPEPTTAERRRYREQAPAFITSRTDLLDRWFYSRRASAGEDVAPKPRMVPSPLADTVDELEARGVRGWLSIGATLLEGSTPTQHKLVKNVRALLDHPSDHGVGRSMTVPTAGTTVREEGWLLVWATLPAGTNLVNEERRLRGYLQTKKHQLSLSRGALFLYDETTRQLVDVYFDDHVGPLPQDLAGFLPTLRPPSALVNWPHPDGWAAPSSAGRRRGR